MSVRDALVEEIRKIVDPKKVVVIPVEDNKDTLDKITIMVRQRAISRLPESPNGALRLDYVLTITSAATDPKKSEPELDDFVPSFLDDLDNLAWFGWTEANKVLDEQYIAYDVSAFVLATPEGKGQ